MDYSAESPGGGGGSRPGSECVCNALISWLIVTRLSRHDRLPLRDARIMPE